MMLAGAPALIRSASIQHHGSRIVVTIPDDPAGPVATGHFPGLTIFPGVGLIECADQAARAALTELAEPLPAVPATIESARFLSPVFPGDQVVADAEITSAGEGWICSARLSVLPTLTLCALVRLRYSRVCTR
jgi:3-hydroxyacyl-[acyl-carrier-protein] dehydratase